MSIRQRIEELERSAPKGIVLYLKNGGTYVTRPMTGQQFLHAVLEVARTGQGELAEPLAQCVGIAGKGRLHEIVLSAREWRGALWKRSL